MKFTIYQESRPGKRPSNQDRIAYCYSRDALFMVVADGMGGHLHGEVAAQIAVQYITEAFQRESHPANLADPFLFLSGAISNAHHAILDYAADRFLPEAPRTTCVACIVQDSIAYWAHAGDSRLYVIRGGRILAQTRDHSRVQRMLEDGLISAEEAVNHPARNRIFSCLGGGHMPQIDYSRKTPLMTGDMVVLCTDGVWGPLSNELITGALSEGNVMQAVPALLNQAESRGGANADNLSMIAMRWEENYTEDTLGSVSTKTMPVDSFTTQMEEFAKARKGAQPLPNLSDDEIEQAIQEINAAIRKFSK
ncbi:MAG: serine/threonine-protein phosphatase [Rhodocyclaceae bacterium]|jgi:serine/threonine protein phosphatase PrpC|nr:serine/threonine-protein phosphatase [Rhodocyclaceae bacterium]